MKSRQQRQRRRFFVACEGESEESFIKWISGLAEARNLNLHLHPVNLEGGGFRKMLEQAVMREARERKQNGPFRGRFLLLDADRVADDPWSIEKLRTEAGQNGFTTILQQPNFEGVLLRMHEGCERDFLCKAATESRLKSRWPHYRKAMDALELARKFNLEDLLRAGRADPFLAELLKRLGFAIQPRPHGCHTAR